MCACIKEISSGARTQIICGDRGAERHQSVRKRRRWRARVPTTVWVGTLARNAHESLPKFWLGLVRANSAAGFTPTADHSSSETVNQATCLRANQPSNQLTKQPANQSANKPTRHLSSSQPTSQPSSQPIRQAINQPASSPVQRQSVYAQRGAKRIGNGGHQRGEKLSSQQA